MTWMAQSSVLLLLPGKFIRNSGLSMLCSRLMAKREDFQSGGYLSSTRLSGKVKPFDYVFSLVPARLQVGKGREDFLPLSLPSYSACSSHTSHPPTSTKTIRPLLLSSKGSMSDRDNSPVPRELLIRSLCTGSCQAGYWIKRKLAGGANKRGLGWERGRDALPPKRSPLTG